MFVLRAKMFTVGLLGAAVILPLDLAEASQVGQASWYALHSRTASGEMMNPSELTAAHRSLPFGTKVLVENLNNGRTVLVRINDRGPFTGGRIIDLSKAAAANIGMIDSGVARVRVTHSGGGALAALGRETSAAAKAAVTQEKKVETVKPRPANVAASRGAQKTKGPVMNTKQAVKLPARKTASVKESHVRQSTLKRTQVTSKNGARKRTVQAHYNPYAILGGTPGFMKPAAKRSGNGAARV